MLTFVVSTVGHNPGDEFIRLGQQYLLRQTFDRPVFHVVNKHDPRTMFRGYCGTNPRPNRLLSPHLTRWYRMASVRPCDDMLKQADLVLFAGTPFIWRQNARVFRSTCANAEWVPFTWARLFGELPSVPVLNLAAGTSVTRTSQVDEILADRTIADFLTRAAKRAAITTARDRLTREILGRLGLEVPMITCSSILAAKGAELEPQRPEYIALNVIPRAVHAGRGYHGEAAKWRESIRAVVAKLERRYRIVFVSHSQDEDDFAAEVFPGKERIFSRDPLLLLKAYSKAYFGVCNRVHGAMGIATFARPALVIGGDSRVELVQQAGLPTLDHRSAEIPEIEAAIDDIERNYRFYVTRLEQQIRKTEEQYLTLLRGYASGSRPSVLDHATGTR